MIVVDDDVLFDRLSYWTEDSREPSHFSRRIYFKTSCALSCIPVRYEVIPTCQTDNQLSLTQDLLILFPAGQL